MSPKRIGVCLFLAALLVAPTAASATAVTITPRPRTPYVFYVWFADGGPHPRAGVDTFGDYAGPEKPDRFRCGFGAVENCKRQVMDLLQKWYADFNVILTTKKPLTDNYFLGVVAGSAFQDSSGIQSCRGPYFPAMSWSTRCGDLVTCACIIAQENGHNVGLGHTANSVDVMSGECNAGAQGFSRRTSGTNRCSSVQNSYAKMLDVLGKWPAGQPKPDPFGPPVQVDTIPKSGDCWGADTSNPSIEIRSPMPGTRVKRRFTISANVTDNCYVAAVDVEAGGVKYEHTGQGPFSWDIDAPDGPLSIRLTAFDSEDLTAVSTIDVVVDGAGAPDNGGNPTGGGGADAGGDGAATDGQAGHAGDGGPDGGDDAGSAPGETHSGCSLGQGPASGSGMAAMCVALAAAITRLRRRCLRICLPTCALGLACQGADVGWAPGGVGSPLVEDEGASVLEGMMVGDTLRWPEDQARPAAEGVANSAAQPRFFWVWYADGSPAPGRFPLGPGSAGTACPGTPPRFQCTFGASVDECKRAVQAKLDQLYADFNIVVTTTRPTGAAYYLAIVTSQHWCPRFGGLEGAAPMLCQGVNPGTDSVCAAFRCTGSVSECASLIAQEQAHLVGLDHTASRTDIMNPTYDGSAEQTFEDRENRVQGSCRPTQNSRKMMMERLGAWPGGTKPGQPAQGGGGEAGAGSAGTGGTGDAGAAGGMVGGVAGSGGTGGADPGSVSPMDVGAGQGTAGGAGMNPRRRDVDGGCSTGGRQDGLAHFCLVVLGLGFLSRRRATLASSTALGLLMLVSCDGSKGTSSPSESDANMAAADSGGPRDGGSGADGAGGGSGNDAGRDLASVPEAGDSSTPASDAAPPACTGPHVAFISGKEFTGTELGQADDVCQKEATQAGLKGRFRAVLSTADADARDRICISGNVKRPNNDLVATAGNWWSRSHEWAIKYYAAGGIHITSVWTGSHSDGTRAMTCNGWKSLTGTGTYGISDEGKEWAEAGLAACASQNPVYCISQ